MNPFNTYMKSYIAACFAIAAMYAFVLGGNQPVLFHIADIAIYGSLLCLAGFILWNIFRYVMPASYISKYQLIFLIVSAISTSILITGTEVFILYLFYPSRIDFLICSIPARLLITLLLFIIIRLFYVAHYEKSKIPENNPDFIKKQSVPDEMTGSFQVPETSGKILQGIIVSPEKTQNPTISAIPPIDRIAVRNGQKIKIIPVEDIIYIKADGDYISISTSEGSWLKEQTMKHTEDMLPADRFVRIHRSYIVNINHISRIERYGDKQQVVLHNNEKIKISAARYQTLRLILGF